MVPFDRPYTTFYWFAIVNIASVGTVFELFDIEYIMTLKSALEITQDNSNPYHSKARCGFLFAFHSNYGSILHHLRDKAKYWSKIVIFSYPLAFDAPLRIFVGILPWRLVWKTRMVRLPDGEKNCTYVYSFRHSPRMWQTGGETDGQTQRDGRRRWQRAGSHFTLSLAQVAYLAYII